MKILFFSPYGRRNGAEMMLLYLLKNLPSDKFQTQIYFGEKGGLIKDFGNIPHHYNKRHYNLPYRIAEKVLSPFKVSLFENHILDIHKKFKPDLWYINTLHMPEVCEIARTRNIPYVVHFHDMLFQYEKIGYKQLKDMVTSAAMVIGCAEVVCDKLKTLGGKKIGLQYEFIDTDKVVYSKDKRAELKEKIGIPKDKFVWAMSGIINYRKGADMVPAIAEQLRKEACIIWLGGNNSGLKYYIEKDIEARKLDNVFFLGAKVDDYYEYLSLADGFLLTSREDPFPLVMIEGAALGKPIVSFNSGGVKEFVKEGMGIVVDSWDSNDLVKAMQQIQQREYNYDERILIEAARDFGVKVQIDKWIDLMARNFQV